MYGTLIIRPYFRWRQLNKRFRAPCFRSWFPGSNLPWYIIQWAVFRYSWVFITEIHFVKGKWFSSHRWRPFLSINVLCTLFVCAGSAIRSYELNIVSHILLMESHWCPFRLEDILYQKGEEQKVTEWKNRTTRIHILIKDCGDKMAELQAKGNPKDRGDAEEQITLSKVLRICLKFFFVERKCLVLISAYYCRGLNFFLTFCMNFFFISFYLITGMQSQNTGIKTRDKCRSGIWKRTIGGWLH